MMTTISKTTIFILCVSFSTSVLSCDIGWYPGYKGTCYYFSRLPLDFIRAMHLCKAVGGQLVEIDNGDEFRVVTRKARNRRFPKFWIGVTDLYSEGVWQKATSLGRQYFTNWYYTQPSNHGNLEHCAEVRPTLNMKWNDLPCTVERYFVCEK